MKSIVKPFVLILLLTACNNSSDPAPEEIDIQEELMDMQVEIAELTGGDFSLLNSMLTQQLTPVWRSWNTLIGEYQYVGLEPVRFNSPWSVIYATVLVRADKIREEAESNDYFHHLGISNVLEAYALMMATDVWGDLPYSAGLVGRIDNPPYDSQAVIYQRISELLDEALLLFDADNGGLDVSAADLYYAGNLANWVLAANGLKARAHLHLGEYEEALLSAQLSFTSALENLELPYDGSTASPWYRYNTDEGLVDFGQGIRELLQDLNDVARSEILDVEIYYQTTYLVSDLPQELVTYREMQFIIAECALELSDPTTANTAYLEAIDASFQELGFDAASQDFLTYIENEDVNPGASGLTKEHVISQKYIGLWLNPETFTDWRRTGFPNLSPTSGLMMPVRWDYPETEYLTNTNAPTEVDIFSDKVWWHQ